MKNLLSLSFFLLLLAACIGGERRIGPYRWECLAPDFDSITLLLEYDFLNYESHEKLEDEIRRLEEASLDISGNRQAECRLVMMEGRLLQRRGMADSAFNTLSRAYDMCDSTMFPYEFFRIRSLLRKLSHNEGSTVYRQLEQELKYYIAVGDSPMTAVSYIDLGNKLYDVGEYDRSLEYLGKANDINKALGLHSIVSKNSINIANIEFALGNIDEGRRLLLELLDSDYIVGDSSAINLIYRNLYSHTNEVGWLIKAYEGVENDVNRRNLKGLYTALLSRYYFDRNDVDSGMYFSHIAYSLLPSVTLYNHRASVLDAYATNLELRGRIDSALQCRKLMEAYSDSAGSIMQSREVIRLSGMRDVQLAIASERERAHRKELYYLAAIFLALVLTAFISFIFYRRHKRDQIASRDSRLELEEGRRHMLAMTLAMEEKNTSFRAIVDEIERMRKEGSIASTEAAKVKNIIKMHLAGSEERDSFRRMFMTVNPDFVQRLQQRWPDLSEPYVKLATYIYVGLDNSQIARLLSIRPESVKQSRWRLRKMLGLAKDDSLDDIIRSIV